MNHPSKDRERWFTKLRAEWFRVMRPMGTWVPWELRDQVQLQETGRRAANAGYRPRTWTDSSDVETRRLMEDLARVAREMRLDVGMFDAIVDDKGCHYIIDVNVTPAYNHPIPGVIEYTR